MPTVHTDRSFRLRVHLNFGGSRNNYKNYELFHLASKEESFETLKSKVFTKLSINPALAPYFYFSLKRLHTIEKDGNCLRPNDWDSVYDTVEREEMRWAGSLIVIVSDRREEMMHMTQSEPFDEDYFLVEAMSPPDHIVDLIPESTEFAHQNIISYSSVYSQIDSESSFEISTGHSISSQHTDEIEVSSLKTGRLFKLQNVNGREAYKEMYALLTSDSLWFRPYVAQAAPTSTVLLQEIILDDITAVVATDLDPSGCSFTVTVPFVNEMTPSSVGIRFEATDHEKTTRVHHSFKAKSAAECQSWVDTIHHRNHISAENDVILMADAYSSVAEEETSARDIDILVDCTTFEGTLKNGYMREKFQNHLCNNTEDELLLFWEYCEDYRKGHPDSTDPFDFSADFIKNVKGSRAVSIDASSRAQKKEDITVGRKVEPTVNATRPKNDPALVKSWARYIYNMFVVDGATMQIACPSKDRRRVEDLLESDTAPHDLYHPLQTQIYNQLKFQKFTDFVKCSNFRKVLLSTVMNNINQCPVTGQIWCTIAPCIPSKLVTSPADFYPTIFPQIESSLTNKAGGRYDGDLPGSKSNTLLSWSPGQYDMATFPYSDSLKYEVEKDYINNYSKIPLEAGAAASKKDSSDKTEEAPSRFPRFRALTMSFAKKDAVPAPAAVGRLTSVSRDEASGSDDAAERAAMDDRARNCQSIIPTPWRFVGETGLSLSTPPHWMPLYWWRYVNPNVSQTYDQSYDEQMFNLLPEWIKCIIINKIRSSVGDGTQGSSGAKPTNLLHNYTKAVNKVQTVQAVSENSSSEAVSSLESDVILHTCSSPTAHGISFTTCGGYDLTQAKSQRIPVPHIARLIAFRHQWATLPIPGRVVAMTYMLVSYTNSSNCHRGEYTFDVKAGAGDPDDEVERPSTMDSPSATGISQQAMLSSASRRLCVLSYANSSADKACNKEGELRLYGSTYSDLYAVIRLSLVTKLSPSVNLMNTIDLTDESGAVWHLCPDDVSMYSNCANLSSNNYKMHIKKLEREEAIEIIPEPSACKVWLHHLALLCSSRAYAVRILHEGFLSKRGRVNTAFRRRWFIMTSEMVLLYYSRSEYAGQSKFKGALNLLDVRDVVVHENGKDIAIHTSTRDWVLKAESEKEATAWQHVIERI